MPGKRRGARRWYEHRRAPRVDRVRCGPVDPTTRSDPVGPVTGPPPRAAPRGDQRCGSLLLLGSPTPRKRWVGRESSTGSGGPRTRGRARLFPGISSSPGRSTGSTARVHRPGPPSTGSAPVCGDRTSRPASPGRGQHQPGGLERASYGAGRVDGSGAVAVHAHRVDPAAQHHGLRGDRRDPVEQRAGLVAGQQPVAARSRGRGTPRAYVAPAAAACSRSVPAGRARRGGPTRRAPRQPARGRRGPGGRERRAA